MAPLLLGLRETGANPVTLNLAFKAFDIVVAALIFTAFV